MDKKDFPIKVVEIRATDHRSPFETQGGPAKTFGEVTSQTRRVLTSQINDSLKYFQAQFARWPDIPAVVKITLKEDALAKSHRPTAILTKQTCPIIGTLDFGEILVSATSEGLTKLSNKILQTESQKPIANISAIEKIEPYKARENGISLDVNTNDLIKNDILLKIHVFDHANFEINHRIHKALFEHSEELGIELEEIHYGTCISAFKATANSKILSAEFGTFIGLQSLSAMPHYRPGDFELQSTPIGVVDETMLPPPDSDIDYPIVGVIDSGICTHSTLLAPWIVARENYVPVALQDNSHGTMVAGLIVGARSLNNQDPRFPHSQAKVIDVPVFERNSFLSEEILVSIIEEVIPKYPDVHVWNLSLGSETPSSPSEFSDFACFLDEMHDVHNCLFVVASGNHHHMQAWPQTVKKGGVDRVSSPGDSIRSLTVGAIANKEAANSLSKMEEPSPFSRRGPGPCFIPKPEVTHYGGNCAANSGFAQMGVLSIGPNNALYETLGTSFATPLVSAQAAYLWKYLDSDDSASSPERVKALLIHSALIKSQKVTNKTINHYGFGQPRDILDSLYCEPNSITLMFETDLRHGGHEFERVPFPIADCLYTEDGKFKGEILMTVAYSPITDIKFKSEYCRTNVDVGMGKSISVIDNDGSEKFEFNSVVPVAPSDLGQLYEKYQIVNGFKWSPVKAYYAKFPRGKDVETWRLKMKVTRRAELELPDRPQRATLLLTIRSNTHDQPVYNEAIVAMNQAGWITNSIDEHIRVKT